MANRPHPRSRSFRLLFTTVVGLASMLAVVAADRLTATATLDADGFLDAPFFRYFGPFVDGARISGPYSELFLPGLRARAPVSVALAVASARPKAQRLGLIANGSLVQTRETGGRYSVVEGSAWTDDRGVLRLRLAGEDGPGDFRVSWLRVSHERPGRLPIGRALTYLCLVVATLVAVRLWGGGRALFALVAPVAAALAAWAVHHNRILALGYLPRIAVALCGATVVALLAVVWLRLPRSAAAWLAVAFAFRGLIATHPAFPSIDATFHAHNIDRFRAGETLSSEVSDFRGQSFPIPYPPALYAVLAPFVAAGDTPTGELLVRVTLLIFEGTAPLLVAAILRSAGASPPAQAAAAVAAAVMPEPLLIVAKGIAANAAGSWLTLWVVLAVVSAWPAVVVAALVGLAALSHPGAAAALAGLLTLWMGAEARTDHAGRVRAVRVLLLAALGYSMAWVLYYRDVSSLTASTMGYFTGQGPESARSFFGPRWIHLGKMAQDLVLKFGGGPVVLAVLGMRSGLLPPALRRLLTAWLAGAAVLAAIAFVSPFGLRFEYFATPAVAMAAGCAAAGLRSPWRVPLGLVWAASLGLQVALGLLILGGRFDLINVIIPSPRWPLFPGR